MISKIPFEFKKEFQNGAFTKFQFDNNFALHISFYFWHFWHSKLSFLGRDSNTDLAGYIDGLFCSFSSVSWNGPVTDKFYAQYLRSQFFLWNWLTNLTQICVMSQAETMDVKVLIQKRSYTWFFLMPKTPYMRGCRFRDCIVLQYLCILANRVRHKSLNDF